MLNDTIRLAGRTIQNRVVIQPMEGCDCNADGSPGTFTETKYKRYAEAGAGIVWLEASAVCAEGRTNERQMRVTEQNVGAFARFADEIRETAVRACGFAPLLILQLTHSGRQSIEPMIAYRNPVYEERRPVTDGAIVTDAYLDALPDKFAAAATLAARAGFDGVDVKSCHGYLLQELLSAYEREGRYGGSFENRTRCYTDCFAAVKSAIPSAVLTTRLGLSDMVARPYGFGTDEAGNLDLTEALALIGKLAEQGLHLLNVTLGNPYFNPHVNRPFRTGAYKPPETAEAGIERFRYAEKAVKAAFPDLPTVGTGISYYRGNLMEKAEQLLADGVCDFVGFGRSALAYPAFYRDYLSGAFDARKCCVTCSKCTTLMRRGRISGCATFDPYYKELYRSMGE